MGALLIFLLIVCAYAANDYNFYFYDIMLNTVYEINTMRFDSNKIPISKHYFRIPVENIDEDQEYSYFQVKFLKGDKIDFKVKASGFFMNVQWL